MPLFVIERNIPEAGALSADQLASIARRSNAVVDDLEPAYRWLHSYVTDDRIYCIHEAPDEDTVREHARRGEFPADLVAEVATVFGPDTAKP